MTNNTAIGLITIFREMFEYTTDFRQTGRGTRILCYYMPSLFLLNKYNPASKNSLHMASNTVGATELRL